MHRDVREALLKEFDLAMAEGNREVMQSLMDSVKACLTDASVEVRLHAAGLVEQVLPRCATHECDYLADVLSGVLCEVLVREDDPRVFGRFARITSDEAQRGLKRADYDTVRRIVAALSRPEGPAPNRAVRAQQVSALHELVNSAFFDLLLDDLASGDPARESAATFVLSTFREIIVSKAIRALAISENMRTRLAIVSILKPYARVALDEVKERFRAAAPPNELKRILSVMGELLPESGAVISLGLAHPSDDVAAEAARALFKQPSEMLTTGLAEMLHHDRLAIRMEALHIIGEMKLTSVEETVRECLGSPSEEVAREACVTLGKLGSANSVPELCRILRSRGFLGLFGGVSPSVRAAAAWALGQIGDPKAVPALRKAERERTSAVSAAARLALQPFKAS
jgi:HEAT repeat protein